MENQKRVFDENKQNELFGCDLALGKIEYDKLFIAHHDANEEVLEQSHFEITNTYENGGQDVREVIDIPHKPPRGAYDEYEEINIFIPYTAEELAKNKEESYKADIIAKIRVNYSINDELALHRQKDTKPTEWAEYDAYCENCKQEIRLKEGVI